MQIQRIILTGSIKSLVVRILGTLAVFGLHVFLARFLSADAYGNYNFLITIIALGALCAQAGFDKAAIAVLPAALAEGKEGDAAAFAHWTSRLVFLLGGLIGVFAASLLLFSNDLVAGLGTFVLVAMLVPALALVQFSQQIARALRKIVISQLFEQIAIPVGITLVCLVWVASGTVLDLTGVLLVQLLLSIVAAIVVWNCLTITRQAANSRQLDNPAQSKAGWWEIARPLWGAGLLSFILARGEIIVLGFIVESAQLAQYSVALRITNLMIFGLAAANAIGGPVFSELYRKNDARGLQQAVSTSVVIALIISIPIASIALLAPNLVLGVFGEEYVAAQWILAVLVVGNIVNVLSGPVGPLLSVTGQQNFYFRVVAISAVAKIVLVGFAAYAFGIIGAAVAAAMVTMIWNIWLALGARRLLGVNVFAFWRLAFKQP